MIFDVALIMIMEIKCAAQKKKKLTLLVVQIKVSSQPIDDIHE
jgi:hypothetical protein